MSYVDIAGHPTWLVDEGSGPPLLLLHGGLHGTDALLPALGTLGEGRRLVAFDRRGHGRTADTPDAFHYESMADEAIAVLDDRNIAAADIVGYSDGADVAMHVAMARPDLVRSLVLISGNITPLSEQAATIDPDAPATALLRAIHDMLSPDGPEHFDVIARKTVEMFLAEPTFDVDQLATIEAPALVIAADRDDIALEETIALFAALPNANLAIVPNATHALPWEYPEVVTTLINQFLARLG